MANPYGKAILIGIVAGMRCFLAPALLVKKSDEPCESASCTIPSTALSFLAAGELVGDKTPYIGNRTDPGPLFGRIVSGAICGGAVAKKNGGEPAIGLIAGGLSAFASAHACYLTRRELAKVTGAPDLVLALAEDAAAFGIGSAAVK